MSKGKAIDNPAEPICNDNGQPQAEIAHTDCCSDPLIFAMRDKHHEFSMGLHTILQCLRIAEKEGHVPPLPDEWWISIRYSFGMHYSHEGEF